MREVRDMENTDKTENTRLGINVPGRLLKRIFFARPIFQFEKFAKKNGLKNNQIFSKMTQKRKNSGKLCIFVF